jgi:tagatose-1,6-bisphosphate aldolase non-catalytic subunit AgaZ/GatZ
MFKRTFASIAQQGCAANMRNIVKMERKYYKILCDIVHSSDCNILNNNNQFYDNTSSYDKYVEQHLLIIKTKYFKNIN